MRLECLSIKWLCYFLQQRQQTTHVLTNIYAHMHKYSGISKESTEIMHAILLQKTVHTKSICAVVNHLCLSSIYENQRRYVYIVG